jgi:gas vesicle protein
MGYLRGLRHGAIAGAVLGLLYAPESGASIRRRVSRLLGQAEEMLAAGSGAPSAPVTPRRRTVGGTESRARRS